MASFVFQSVPERYDLRRQIKPGTADTWYATRYRKEMTPGSTVFFWMSGGPDIRGLYGWGRLISEPYLKAGWDGYGVDVAYERRLHRPILASRVRQDPLLSEMLIMRAPQATNFLLTEAEAERLSDLVATQGEVAPEREAL